MKQSGPEEKPFFKEKLHETHAERHRKLREAGLTPHEIQRINGVLDWQLRILRAVLDILSEHIPSLKSSAGNPELLEKRRAFFAISSDIRKNLEHELATDDSIDPIDLREIVREELMVFFESVLITHVRRPEKIEQDRVEVKTFLEEIIHSLKAKAEEKSRDPKRPLLTLLPEDVTKEVKEALAEGQKVPTHPLNETRVIDFLQRMTDLALFHNERDKQNSRIRIFWEAARTIHKISKSNLELTNATPEEIEEIISTFLNIATRLEEKLPVMFKEGSTHRPTQNILTELSERFGVVMQNHVAPIRDLQREYESVVKVFVNPKLSLQNFITQCQKLQQITTHLREPAASTLEPEEVPLDPDARGGFSLNQEAQEVIQMQTLVQSLLTTARGAQDEITKLMQYIQKENDSPFASAIPIFKNIHTHLQEHILELSQLNRNMRRPLIVAMRRGHVEQGTIISRLDLAEQFTANVKTDDMEKSIAMLQTYRHLKGREEIKKEGFQNKLLSHMTMFRKQYLVPAALHLAYTDPRNSRSLSELIKDMFHEGMEEVVSLLKYTLQIKRRLDAHLTRKLLNKPKGDGFYPPNFPAIESHLRTALEQDQSEETVLNEVRQLFYQLETDFIPAVHQLRGHAAIYNQDSASLNDDAVGVTRLLIEFDLHLQQIFALRSQGRMTTPEQYSLFDFSEAMEQIFKHLEKIQGQLFSMATSIQMRGEHELHKMSRKGFVLPSEEEDTEEPQTDRQTFLSDEDLAD